MQSSQKIVNLGLILAGVAVFLFLSNMIQALWGLARLPRMQEWIILPTDLISFALTVGGCFYSRRHEKANKFLNEVAIELSKVTWPENKETVISTGISCVMVVICAVILLTFDSLWGTIMRGLFAL
jgi:preprotein translocase SecE subunit